MVQEVCARFAAEQLAETPKWIFLLESSLEYRTVALNHLFMNIIQEATAIGASRFIKLDNTDEIGGYVALYDTDNYPCWWNMYRKTFCDKKNVTIEAFEKGFIDRRFLQLQHEYGHHEDELITKRCYYVDHLTFATLPIDKKEVVERMLFEQIIDDARKANFEIVVKVESEEDRLMFMDHGFVQLKTIEVLDWTWDYLYFDPIE